MGFAGHVGRVASAQAAQAARSLQVTLCQSKVLDIVMLLVVEATVILVRGLVLVFAGTSDIFNNRVTVGAQLRLFIWETSSVDNGPGRHPEDDVVRTFLLRASAKPFQAFVW